jgi:hypothetical protein
MVYRQDKKHTFLDQHVFLEKEFPEGINWVGLLFPFGSSIDHLKNVDVIEYTCKCDLKMLIKNIRKRRLILGQ